MAKIHNKIRKLQMCKQSSPLTGFGRTLLLVLPANTQGK